MDSLYSNCRARNCITLKKNKKKLLIAVNMPKFVRNTRNFHAAKPDFHELQFIIYNTEQSHFPIFVVTQPANRGELVVTPDSRATPGKGEDA